MLRRYANIPSFYESASPTHKPIKMNKQSKKLMRAEFALLETILYLDTHPNDQQALKYYANAKNEYVAAKNEYEAMHGPLSAGSDSAVADGSWSWSTSPWPWQTNEE